MKSTISLLRIFVIMTLLAGTVAQGQAQYRSRSQSRRHTGNYDDMVDIRLPRPGTLEAEMGRKQAEMVRYLRIEGTINRDDINFIKKLCKRSHVYDRDHRKVDNYLDVDLEYVRLESRGLFGSYRTYTIEPNWFDYCTHLRSIVLPDRITSIGRNAFYDCDRLEEVYMPPTVTVIGEGAFDNCTELTRIDLPRDLEVIEKRAFYRCDDLVSIRLGDRLEELGEEALAQSGITRIELPRSLRLIGKNAFDKTKLRQIFIPANAQIDGNYLGQLPQLDIIEVDADNGYYTVQDGVLCDYDLTTVLQCPANLTGTVHVTDGVRTIGQRAFVGCGHLTAVMLPPSVTVIGDYAFSGCQLQSVKMSENINRMGVGAFNNCSRLTTATLPQALTALPESAFQGCKALRQVDFGPQLATIGEKAFKGCGLGSLDLPESLREIGKEAFRECNALTQVVIPPYCNIVGKEAFRACKNIRLFELGSNVTTIGDNALRETAITVLNIPPKVSNIGKKIVEKCKSLTRINCHPTVPPILDKVSDDKTPLFVPGASVPAYKTAKNWKNFKQIQSLEEY